jgi:hypothetical protein
MKLNGLTSLPRNHIIQLTGEVLTREREVLGEDDRTKDVLPEGLLEALLVGVGQPPVHFLRLIGDNLVKH